MVLVCFCFDKIFVLKLSKLIKKSEFIKSRLNTHILFNVSHYHMITMCSNGNWLICSPKNVNMKFYKGNCDYFMNHSNFAFVFVSV